MVKMVKQRKSNRTPRISRIVVRTVGEGPSMQIGYFHTVVPTIAAIRWKGFRMFVEQRTYTIKPGQVPAYLALYEAEGFAVQVRHLGNLVGYYTSEIGELSQIVHMWGYKDLLDREHRRKALYHDPQWQSVVTRLFAMIDRMENKILIPTTFSPVNRD